MAATLDLLSDAEVQAALGLAGADSLAEAISTGVSLRLDELCGPVVQRTVTDETHDGGHPEVFLDQAPAASITSVVEYDGTTDTTLTAETNALKPADAYLAELGPGIIRRRSSNADSLFPRGRRNIVVTYTAGRVADTASVTEKFKRAAVIMLQNLWRSHEFDVADFGDFDVPRRSIPRVAVPAAVQHLLADEWRDSPRVA